MKLSENIDKDWPFALETLKPAYCRIFSVDRLEDYYDLVKNNLMQLWIIEGKGAVITSIESGQNGRLLAIRFLGGKNLRAWANDLEETLTEFARKNNCKQIEAVTRKGFSRLIKSFKSQGLDLFVKVV